MTRLRVGLWAIATAVGLTGTGGVSPASGTSATGTPDGIPVRESVQANPASAQQTAQKILRTRPVRIHRPLPARQAPPPRTIAIRDPAEAPVPLPDAEPRPDGFGFVGVRSRVRIQPPRAGTAAGKDRQTSETGPTGRQAVPWPRTGFIIGDAVPAEKPGKEASGPGQRKPGQRKPGPRKAANPAPRRTEPSEAGQKKRQTARKAGPSEADGQKKHQKKQQTAGPANPAPEKPVVSIVAATGTGVPTASPPAEAASQDAATGTIALRAEPPETRKAPAPAKASPVVTSPAVAPEKKKKSQTSTRPKKAATGKPTRKTARKPARDRKKPAAERVRWEEVIPLAPGTTGPVADSTNPTGTPLAVAGEQKARSPISGREVPEGRAVEMRSLLARSRARLLPELDRQDTTPEDLPVGDVNQAWAVPVSHPTLNRLQMAEPVVEALRSFLQDRRAGSFAVSSDGSHFSIVWCKQQERCSQESVMEAVQRCVRGGVGACHLYTTKKQRG